mmetsp:Transcript_4918/g.10398  ORF Transcript_4918/g.10398 Transcript_4918/m.10398 type:complete len:338 (+) Transcript_4918:18-1031(+)
MCFYSLPIVSCPGFETDKNTDSYCVVIVTTITASSQVLLSSVPSFSQSLRPAAPTSAPSAHSVTVKGKKGSKSPKTRKLQIKELRPENLIIGVPTTPASSFASTTYTLDKEAENALEEIKMSIGNGDYEGDIIVMVTYLGTELPNKPNPRPVQNEAQNKVQNKALAGSILGVLLCTFLIAFSIARRNIQKNMTHHALASLQDDSDWESLWGVDISIGDYGLTALPNERDLLNRTPLVGIDPMMKPHDEEDFWEIIMGEDISAVSIGDYRHTVFSERSDDGLYRTPLLRTDSYNEIVGPITYDEERVHVELKPPSGSLFISNSESENEDVYSEDSIEL